MTPTQVIDPSQLGDSRPGDALWAQRGEVVILEGLLSVDVCRVVARRAGLAFEQTNPHAVTAFPRRLGGDMLGRCLDLVERDDDLGAYLNLVGDTESALASLFDDALGDTFARVLEDWLGSLTTRSLRRVQVLGRPLMPCTLRRFGAQGFIPPHCEREQLRRFSGRVLAGVIDPETILSYYLLVQAPGSGGELELFDLRWQNVSDDDLRADGYTRLTRRLGDVSARPVRLHTGDLVLFTAGDVFHRVTPVVEGPERLTLGGFLALSADGQVAYYWS